MRTALHRLLLALLMIATAGHASARTDVVPLLTTQWGQRGLYAQYTPKKQRLGCWSTAIAQILHYHKLQPTGLVRYEGEGYRISEALDHVFDWKLFADKLTRSTPKSKRTEVSRFSYYVAIAIGKDFVEDAAYKGNSDVRRKGLTEHFPCKTQRYSSSRQSPQAVRDAILGELQDKRPLMLYIEGGKGLGHAFVIDAVREQSNKFEVHLNCGWEGRDDGWFEFNKPIKTSRGLFNSPERWVLAIRPNQ
jgi:hypothetical protein